MIFSSKTQLSVVRGDFTYYHENMQNLCIKILSLTKYHFEIHRNCKVTSVYVDRLIHIQKE